MPEEKGFRGSALDAPAEYAKDLQDSVVMELDPIPSGWAQPFHLPSTYLLASADARAMLSQLNAAFMDQLEFYTWSPARNKVRIATPDLTVTLRIHPDERDWYSLLSVTMVYDKQKTPTDQVKRLLTAQMMAVDPEKVLWSDVPAVQSLGLRTLEDALAHQKYLM